jgi:hypothetical protein
MAGSEAAKVAVLFISRFFISRIGLPPAQFPYGPQLGPAGRHFIPPSREALVRQQTPQPRPVLRTRLGVCFCGGPCLNLHCREKFVGRGFWATGSAGDEDLRMLLQRMNPLSA